MVSLSNHEAGLAAGQAPRRARASSFDKLRMRSSLRQKPTGGLMVSLSNHEAGLAAGQAQ